MRRDLENFAGRVALFVLLLLSFASCKAISEDPPVREEKGRTLLIYMAGNNNLAPYAKSNLEKLMNGYIPVEEGNIVVFYHIAGSDPLLLRLNGENGDVVVDTVYRFPSLNSASGKTLSSAMNVTRTLFPAKDYGLVLWSHATGWMPEGSYGQALAGGSNSIVACSQQPAFPLEGNHDELVKLDRTLFNRNAKEGRTRTFGSDGTTEMEIADMVKSMPYRVSFVIFDACFMGGIEVAYQMKDSTDYLLFSPAEVLAEGFPYDKIAQPLFASSVDLQKVAEEYYQYYNSQSPPMRSATISLVKSAALERVAEEAARLFDLYRDKIPMLDKERIQGYFRQASTPFFYDFKDFMQNLAGEGNSIEDFSVALDEAVVYKAATPYMINLHIDADKYSGLSSYIPDSSSEELIEFYRTLDWNNAARMIVE